MIRPLAASIALWRVKAILTLREIPCRWPAVVANDHGGQLVDFFDCWGRNG